MQSFTNRVILITGAGSGIGRQLAVTLAAEGAAVAAIDLRAELLSALIADMAGKKLACAVGDVTDRTSLKAAVKEVESKLGPVDILIANAGIGLENSALNFRGEDFEAQIRVNLIGVANSVEAVLPGMIERRRGHLVAMSSLASYRGLPLMAGYCASKSGVNALFESLRLELAPFGIDTTIVCPGWIKTPLTANIGVPKPNMLDLEVAVRVIVDTIRRRRLYHAFPRTPRLQVRLLRWLPSGISDRLIQMLLRALTKN